MNHERPVHQSGSSFFQKCLYSKLKNSGKSKNIQVLERHSCIDPKQYKEISMSLNMISTLASA